MQLFDKDGNGAEEIVSSIGIIDEHLNFSKWAPILPMGIRDLSAIIGSEVVAAIDQYYREDDGTFLSSGDSPSDPSSTDGGSTAAPSDDVMREAVRLARQAAAMFAWLRIIPTLDVQHGSAGRSRRLGENEKGLTAAQEFKDEENIRTMAYEAVDALVELLDTHELEFWMHSRTKLDLAGLLIPDRRTFDRYYTIGSHRLFLTLAPMIREVQESQVIPIITRDRYLRMVDGDEELRAILLEPCRRPLALLAIKKAVERLPVEVLPMGIVQVQQTATIRDKVRAEKSAREAVAASLGDDAAAMLDRLADLVKELDTTDQETDYHVPGPTLQTRGITF